MIEDLEKIIAKFKESAKEGFAMTAKARMNGDENNMSDKLIGESDGLMWCATQLENFLKGKCVLLEGA